MNRRGFLGALGGAAVGTPAALKSAIAKGSAERLSNIPSGVLGYSNACPESHRGSWRAHDVLRLLRPESQPSRSRVHQDRYEDIECLVSVSRSHKSRMTAERERQSQLEFAVAEFIAEQKLDWVGLTEETVIRLAKKAAGE